MIRNVLIVLGFIFFVYFFGAVQGGFKWLLGYASPREYSELSPRGYTALWIAVIALISLTAGVGIWRSCVLFIFRLFSSEKSVRQVDVLIILFLFAFSLPLPVLIFFGATDYERGSAIAHVIGMVLAGSGIAWYAIIQELSGSSSEDDEQPPGPTTPAA